MARTENQAPTTETASTDAPKRDYAQEAKVASNPEARQDAGEKVLAEQLKQQAEGDQPADVIAESDQATRAAHSAEGGGAWPEDLLRERYLTPAAPVVGFSPEQAYTSHEKQDSDKS